MVRFEGGTVVFETTWIAVKNQLDTRKLDFRFENDNTAYEIFAVDGNFIYKTTIYKSGQAPENQATHDAWRIDFETNYRNRVVDFNNTESVFISTIDGYSVVLKDGAAPTINDGYGIAVIGYDGSNYRMIRMNNSGNPIVVGAGSAGTPTGGVFSIQGIPGGTTIPVSGTVAANQNGTWIVQPGNTANTTPWLTTINGGGNSATVTASNALKVDGSAVTQPVSGTVTANAGTGNFTIIQPTASNLNAQIVGPGSTGTALVGNPVRIAGSDGTNTRNISTDTSGRIIISPVSINTYSASNIFGVANSATDIFTISGSASRVIKITRLVVTATQTTSSQRDILVIKRSAANTGGTSSILTAISHDSNSPAATVTVRSYTTNPSALGTSIGTVRSRKLFIGATTANSDEFIIEAGNRDALPFILRGTSQFLCVNLNGVTSAGNNFCINVEWTEE